MSYRISTTCSLLFACCVLGTTSHAHFPWLVRGEDGKVIYFFGEDITDRNYHMPPSIAKAEIKRLTDSGDSKVLTLTEVDRDDLVGRISKQNVPHDARLSSHVTYGIYNGNRLDYYSLHQGGKLPKTRGEAGGQAKELQLYAEVVDTEEGVDVFVTWKGEPLKDVEVHLYCDEGHEEGVATTDARGKASFTDAEVEEGLNGIMLGHNVERSGKVDDARYDAESHYLTLTFYDPESYSVEQNNSTSSSDDGQARSLPPLPFEITSFGAARSGDAIYVYGGHTGSAHSYSTEEQSNKLLKLDLSASEPTWQEISTGQQRLQGLGMVAYQGKLIMIGGFTAKNAQGEDHDLHSQESVYVYDPANGDWSQLPPLPEPRSSHDVAVIDDTIYVVGGWNMSGEKNTQWHSTAWSMDLSADEPVWVALPEPPFTRRALATVAHQGKLFVIGGMDQEGGPTREVAIFDPGSQAWDSAPEIHGEQAMAGFGSAGWSLDGQLIVTTYEGDIQRWDGVDGSWTRIGETSDARFFHRLLPLDSRQLISLGGANMEEGKFLDLERIHVD